MKLIYIPVDLLGLFIKNKNQYHPPHVCRGTTFLSKIFNQYSSIRPSIILDLMSRGTTPLTRVFYISGSNSITFFITIISTLEAGYAGPLGNYPCHKPLINEILIIEPPYFSLHMHFQNSLDTNQVPLNFFLQPCSIYPPSNLGKNSHYL